MPYILLILILSVVFTCCKRDNTQINNINGSEYFPNSVGDYWKYKYVDSLHNSTSLVDVHIVGSKILPNGQVSKVWILKFTSKVDTNYVYQIGDTIRFLNVYFETVNTYVTPLLLNNKWENSFFFDSVEVKEQRTFILNNKSFDNSFLLNEQGHGFNYNLTSVEWFCPGIGMLTRTRKEFDLGPSDNSYWELVEYQLK